MLHTAYSWQTSSLSPIKHLRMYASIANAHLFLLFKDIVKVDCSKSRNLREVRDSWSRFFDTWGQISLASFKISMELKIQTHANQSNYVSLNIFIAFLNFSCWCFSLKKQFDRSEANQIDNFQIIDSITPWLTWKSVFKYLSFFFVFFTWVIEN